VTNIAFLGTGLLGSALAEAAAGRGDTVVAWNRSIDKARALERFGITVAHSPADAVRGATRVHLVLTDDAVVDDVIAQFRPGLSAHAVIVDHSTTHPELTGERLRRLNDEGVRYLHCPVFIGPATARAGKGTILVAGPERVYELVRSDLARMASRVEYAGERGDLAAVYKLCGNAFFIGLNALIADVFSIAAANGVAPADALRIVQVFDAGAVMADRARGMLERDFSSPSFELTMARKDVQLMVDAASPLPLAVLPGVVARMSELIAGGRGGDNISVMGRDAIG